MSIFDIEYSGLSLGINWFLFLFFLLSMIFLAILIPRFLINLLKHFHIAGGFLTVFLLAIITSLPEIFTLVSFVALDSGGGNGIVKAFANIIGSNWITSVAFAFLLFYNSFILLRFFTTKTLCYSSFFVFLINTFLVLVVLFPDSFLNKAFANFKFFSFFLLLGYLLFNFVLFWQLYKKPKISSSSSELKVNFFHYYYSPFLVLPLLIFFIMMLVALFFFLVPLSNHLQSQHNFSDQSIGGLFFAFATSSPEIWSSLSLLSVGLGYLGLGVIVESHLFNLLLYVVFALVSSEDVYNQLNVDINTLSLLMMVLASFFLFLYTFLFFQKKRLISLFLTIGVVGFSLFGLVNLG